MNEMSDVSSTVTEAIRDDTPCRRCGYNLRGLMPTSLCPECGTPIAQSLVGNLLKHADPDWLERLRFGTSLKLWNILLIAFFMIAAGVLVAAGLPDSLITIAGLVAGALGLWATIVITWQEPRIALQEDPVTLRKAIRVCAAAAFIGGVMTDIDNYGSSLLTIILLIVGSVLSLAGVFVAWGELLYFRRFALRIPDYKLARSTTLLMWIAPITAALVIILGVVSAFVFAAVPGAAVAPAPGGSAVTVTLPPGPGAAPAPGALGGMALVAGACFFGALGLYLVLWYVRLLVKYRKAFRLAADESRASVLPPPNPLPMTQPQA